MKNLLCLLLLVLAFPALGDEDPARPNILFIIADDLSATALGCYGNDQVLTPNIDKLAERGVRFDRAYCQFTVCGPARAALLSGLYPQQNGVTSNDFRERLSKTLGDHPTLPQHFKNNGYTTARCGKLYHMGVPGDITAGASGPDHVKSWTEAYNFKSPEQWTPGITAMLSNEKLKPDPQRTKHYGLGYGTAFYVVQDPTEGAEQHDVQATDKAIELMGKYKQDDTPFFLAVGYVRPHVPLVAPQKYFDLYDADKLKLPKQIDNDLDDIPRAGWTRLGFRTGTDTDAKRREVLHAYYASVSFMDAQVGRLLDELEKQGLADDTIVVFLSDHGYHLGEHDMWQKVSLHEESVRIPLIFAGPEIKEERAAVSMIESVDIYPSLCNLAGLQTPDRCVGKFGILTHDGLFAKNPREGGIRIAAYSMSRNGHLLRSKTAAYIRYNDGSEEFYDMDEDPHQFTNLIGIDPEPKLLLELREMMYRRLEWIEKQ